MDKFQHLSEEMTVVGLVAIAIVGMFVLGAESKDVVLAIGGGLVGYLKGTSKTS